MITGIGGVFFRARDPDGLAEWYERHLGITRVPKSYDDPEGNPIELWEDADPGA